ncbi:hypothetical protein [Clostridium botulinum]|uniref:hypothetical protein n=1 Tax=Clostridium botulinum TaxID=1491 RepID=UPI001C9AEAF7|nr:hypothetical protein [Clostridium botulinum]MBY6918175.1 hypothetical protein [Clostridium botulinum]
MKAQQYNGFTISKGDPRYTMECYTIKTGRGITHHYYGGADSIAQAKEKIDKGIKRIY